MSNASENVSSTIDDPEIKEVKNFAPSFEAALPDLLAALCYEVGTILEELRIIYDLSSWHQQYLSESEKFKEFEDAHKDLCKYQNEIKKLAGDRAYKKVFKFD